MFFIIQAATIEAGIAVFHFTVHSLISLSPSSLSYGISVFPYLISSPSPSVSQQTKIFHLGRTEQFRSTLPRVIAINFTLLSGNENIFSQENCISKVQKAKECRSPLSETTICYSCHLCSNVDR
jgi:hypothetical protein